MTEYDTMTQTSADGYWTVSGALRKSSTDALVNSHVGLGGFGVDSHTISTPAKPLVTSNCDTTAELCGVFAELIHTVTITTPQAYALAVEALERLTLAIEAYEGVL